MIVVVSFCISTFSVFVIFATCFTFSKISLTTQQYFELEREPFQQLQQLKLKRYYFDASDNIVYCVVVIAMIKNISLKIIDPIRRDYRMITDRTQISQLDTKNGCIFIEYGEFCHSSFITPLSDEYNNADAMLINLRDPNDPSGNSNSSSRTCSDPFGQKFNTINKKLYKIKSSRLAVEIDQHDHKLLSRVDIFVILPTKHGMHHQVQVVHVTKLSVVCYSRIPIASENIVSLVLGSENEKQKQDTTSMNTINDYNHLIPIP